MLAYQFHTYLIVINKDVSAKYSDTRFNIQDLGGKIGILAYLKLISGLEDNYQFLNKSKRIQISISIIYDQKESLKKSQNLYSVLWLWEIEEKFDVLSCCWASLFTNIFQKGNTSLGSSIC